MDEKEAKELELLAKRLFVARTQERAVDMATYGPQCYAPWTLEQCRIELGLPPKENL